MKASDLPRDNFLLCFIRRSVGILLLFIFIHSTYADWRFLPNIYGSSVGNIMMNGHGRLVVTESHGGAFNGNSFAVYDVANGVRLFDRYWTNNSFEDLPYVCNLIDTNNYIHLSIPESNLRTYSPEGVFLSESGSLNCFPMYPVVSTLGPEVVHTWWPLPNFGHVVKTTSTDCRLLRCDSIPFGSTYILLAADGAGGYYGLTDSLGDESIKLVFRVDRDGHIQRPVLFNLENGYFTFKLVYAPDSRDLLLITASARDDVHVSYKSYQLDPDSLTTRAMIWMSDFIDDGQFEAAHDTIWFLREVTLPLFPSRVDYYQGIALWAHTPSSGWIATDSFPPAAFPDSANYRPGHAHNYSAPQLIPSPYLTIIKNNRYLFVRYNQTDNQSACSELQREVANSPSVNLNGYPNPFNSATTISYTLPQPEKVVLRLYNLDGQLVTTLLEQSQASGRHYVTLDGSTLAAGSYFLQIKSGAVSQTKKLVLLK